MGLLTVKEAAELLGLKESRVRTAIFRREIPYIKIGALIRLSKNDLIQWLERQTVLPRKCSQW